MPSVSSVLTRAAVRGAIEATIPTGEGFRNRQLFSFARKLKAIPELQDVELLKPFVTEGHKAALPFIKTKAFDITWMDFCHGWENVEFPEGDGPLGVAYVAVLAEPLPPAAP